MVCLTISSVSCDADVSFPLLQDTTIFEGTGLGGAGASPILYAGRLGDLGNGLRRRFLIQFDVLGSRPEGCGASVALATLSLSNGRVKDANKVGLRIHRVEREWKEGSGMNQDAEPGSAEEGEPTWGWRSWQSARWATPGGDFVASPSASSTEACPGRFSCQRSFASLGLAADVERWRQQPSSNYGWIVIGVEDELQTAQQFTSSAATLTVTFAGEAAQATTAPEKTTGDKTTAEEETTPPAETTSPEETISPAETTPSAATTPSEGTTPPLESTKPE